MEETISPRLTDSNGFDVVQYQIDQSQNHQVNPTFQTDQALAEYEADIERKQAEEAEKHSLLNLFGTAVELEWVSSQIGKTTSKNQEADPDFVLTDDVLKVLTEYISEDYHSVFVDARNLQHAFAINRRLYEIQQNEKILMSHGAGTGIGVRLAAAITDPVALSVGLSTGGLGAAGVWGTRLTRMQRAVRGGLVAAGEAALIEGARSQLDPTVQGDDIVYAAVGSMLLGGGLSSLGKVSPEVRQKLEQMQREIEFKSIQESGGELTDLGKKHYADVADSKDTSKPLTYAEVNPDWISMNAAERADKVIEGHESSDIAFGKSVNFTRASLTAGSQNSVLRKVAAMLTEVRTGWRSGDTVSAESAIVWKSHRMDQFLLQKFRAYESEGYRGWTKARGLNPNDLKMRSEFNRRISDLIESDAPVTDSHLKRVVDTYRDMFAELGELQNNPFKREGKQGAPVKGAENFTRNDQYLPHIWNYDKLVKAIQTHGSETVHKLIAKSINGVSKELGQKIAKHLVRVLREARWSDGADFRDWFSLDTDTLVDKLTDMGIDKDVVEEIAHDMGNLVENASAKAGKDKHNKPRLDLDMTAREGNLKITDLFERDVETLFARYSNSQLGRVALARHGILGDQDLKQLKKRITDQYDKLELAGRGVGKTRQRIELKSYDDMVNHLLGRPLHDPNTVLAKGSRLLRKAAFPNVMGQVGFAQIAEIGTLISQIGVKSFIRQIPEFKRLLARAKDGTLPNSLDGELEMITGGFGSRRFLSQVTYFDEEVEGALEGKLRSVEIGLDKMSRFVGDISGMSGITQVMQRMAVKGQIEKLMQQAFKGKRALTMRSYREYGLDDQRFDAVMKNLNKYANGGRLGNGKLTALNWEQWDDRQAAEDFAMLVRKWGQRTIQENSIGDLLPIDDPISKMFLQFRSFVISAHSAQMLHGANHLFQDKDFSVLTKFLLASFFAAVGYTTKVSVMSAGRPDAQEFREEHLTVAEIGKASFSRAGWSALMPTFIDTSSEYLTGEMVFNNRYTGLSNDMTDIDQTPGGSLVANSSRFLSTVLQSALTDRELSRDDLYTLKRIIPLQNAILIDQTLRQLLANAPVPQHSN